MKLTTDTDLTAFLDAVRQCRGDVLFCTPEGDKLNLKSTLSKYLFAALSGDEALLQSGSIICRDLQDEKKLAAFFAPSVGD